MSEERKTKRMQMLESENNSLKRKKDNKWDFMIPLVVFILTGYFVTVGIMAIAYVMPLIGMALTGGIRDTVSDTWRNSSRGKKAGMTIALIFLIPFGVVIFGYLSIMGLMVSVDLLFIVPILGIFGYLIFKNRRDNAIGRLFGSKATLVVSILILAGVLGYWGYSEWKYGEYANMDVDDWLTGYRSDEADSDGNLTLELDNGQITKVNIKKRSDLYIQAVDIFSEHQEGFVGQFDSYTVEYEPSLTSYDVEPEESAYINGIPIQQGEVILSGEHKDTGELNSYQQLLSESDYSTRTNKNGYVKLTNVPHGKYTIWFKAVGYSPIMIDDFVVNDTTTKKDLRLYPTPLYYDITINYEYQGETLDVGSNIGITTGGDLFHVREDVIESSITADVNDVGREELLLEIDADDRYSNNGHRQQLWYGWSNIPNQLSNQMINYELIMDDFTNSLLGDAWNWGVQAYKDAQPTYKLYDVKTYQFYSITIDEDIYWEDSDRTPTYYLKGGQDNREIIGKESGSWTFRIWDDQAEKSSLNFKVRYEIELLQTSSYISITPTLLRTDADYYSQEVVKGETDTLDLGKINFADSPEAPYMKED